MKLQALKGIKSVNKHNRTYNYKQRVTDILDAFQKLWCRMSVKMHVLHSHFNYFPDNYEMFCEKQGERFHQEIIVMDKRYQNQWNVSIIADYCWYLKREDSSKYAKKLVQTLKFFE